MSDVRPYHVTRTASIKNEKFLNTNNNKSKLELLRLL